MRARTRPSARLRVELLEDRSNPSTAYLATDLISDQPGVAPITDPTLVNAWGISLNPAGGAFWVSAAGTGLSEVYGGDVTTNGVTSPLTQPFKVATPGGSPTGQVFNNTGSATDFVITNGTASRPSVFIFASEGGAVTGWTPQVPPLTQARVGFQATDGAIYKGLALAKVGTANFLYAADFHNGKIDVIDGQFQKVAPGTNGFGTFTDPNLPRGYAPFNVALIGGKLYVSYAKQDAAAVDDVAGKGNGFVSVFETNGEFVRRLISRGDLNSPWGMVQAPTIPGAFGDFTGSLLVGNFGSGRIHAYDIATGEKLGTLSQSPGRPLVIDGLWGLAFGNGRTAGDANSLYYAAGPEDETHGVFGKITANAEGTNPVSVKLTGSDLLITGSRDGDRVEVRVARGGREIVVEAGGDEIGRFDAAAVGIVRFNGFAGNDVLTVSDRVTATVVADGGAGNDALFGGGGNNVLLGNAGSDALFGGRDRDILIGGVGGDFLFGGGDDDLLVGGSTAHDTNPTALLQVLDVWTSTTLSYDDRVAAIRAGTGGVPKLDPTTVADDGVRDLLVGALGQDWYLGVSPDLFLGRRPNEQAN